MLILFSPVMLTMLFILIATIFRKTGAAADPLPKLTRRPDVNLYKISNPGHALKMSKASNINSARLIINRSHAPNPFRTSPPQYLN